MVRGAGTTWPIEQRATRVARLLESQLNWSCYHASREYEDLENARRKLSFHMPYDPYNEIGHDAEDTERRRMRNRLVIPKCRKGLLDVSRSLTADELTAVSETDRYEYFREAISRDRSHPYTCTPKSAQVLEARNEYIVWDIRCRNDFERYKLTMQKNGSVRAERTVER